MVPPDTYPSPDQIVTSSDLVRRFGLWQERAARAPLYILHRGRPRFVLTSIETMDALCAQYRADESGASAVRDPGIDATALLDGVRDLVLMADAGGAILASSSAARAHFAGLAAAGAPVEAITAATTRGFLADTIRRVIATGVGDRVEIPSAARAGRMLTLAIAPAAAGVALFGYDSTAERDHVRARATECALGEAMVAAGGTASATINLRGYITAPAASLAALTGLPCEALATIRFVSLAERSGRVALGEAIEAAMAGGPAGTVDASLLVNRADPLAVRIGLAPVRAGGAIDGVAALVRARATA